ncbi:MAG: methyltransferase domain-containing protein [Candidatus Vogelbacteria bacterium]|nr:methyltransferase domain-containing protein [Candidatus Vogelbacteria bacterium]
MKCRICGNTKFDDVLDMGKAPLVNSLLDKKDLSKGEKKYPLVVVRCSKCSLAQLKTIVDSHKIYHDQDYLYFTGDMPQQSQYMRAFDSLVTEVHDKHTKKDDLIVEIGSNDGTVLEKMKDGRRILGVDPATNVVIRALARGVPTLSGPMEGRIARIIKKEFGPSKVVGGANCLAHIDNIHGVMEGVAELLSEDGIFWAEVNYWGGMVKHRHYALVYLDHYSYFSLKNWIDLAQMNGLYVFDAFVTEAQGDGLSLRIFASRDKNRAKSERFKKLVQEEEKTKLNTLKAAKAYGEGCKIEANKLYKVITELKKQGKSIAGYGAAAKGFSVLQLAGITQKHIDYFVDDSPAKQGKYTPVTHIPVISRKDAEKRLPDYFFITAPNYADIIMAKEENFRKGGGKFIFCDGTVTS